MSKIAHYLIYVTIIMSIAEAANAQEANLSLLLAGKPPATQPGRVTHYLNDVNIKAIRHYKANFRDGQKESWSIQEDGYRVNFYLDGIHCLVDYSAKGDWRNTIRIFGEEKMPGELRWNIKTAFFGYNIVTVTELKYGNTLAYFVKLEDKTHLKTVRVINDEMVVVEEYLNGLSK